MLSAEPGDRDHGEADADRSPGRAERVDERDAAPRPDRDDDEDDEQPERRPPGDERHRLEAGLVGEPGERPEHPEAARREDESEGAERNGRSRIRAWYGRGAAPASRRLRAGREVVRSPASGRGDRRRPAPACRAVGVGRAHARRGRRTTAVNGIRISRNVSIETRKPASRKHDARNLPTWK